MRTLAQLFFAPVRRPESPWAVVRWWEARRAGGERWAVVGPALFRYGFAFAVGLTLMPVVVAAGSWGVRILIALGGR